VKGEGVVATLYASGKFVEQGADPELFLSRWTDLEATSSPGASAGEADPVALVSEPTCGSDEAGKGDYFGPLVVAAVRLVPEEAQELGALGVTDSKRLSDPRALRLAAHLRERVPHAIRRLDPSEYNRIYPEYRGLNPLLAELHADVLRRVARPGDRALVDQFAAADVMQRAAGELDVRLVQAPRAERNAAVAAASVLARAEFLLALAELSSQWEVELRKGAGAPTDAAGVAFSRRHGVESLGQVAKLHFKNTAKIERRL